MLCRIFRVELELLHRPLLDGTHTRSRCELAFDSVVEKMNGRLDPFAVADMDARSMPNAVNRTMALACLMLFGLVDEDERLVIQLNAGCSQDVIQLTNGCDL